MATKKNVAGPKTKGLEVMARVDGFRRAGRAWTGTTTVPLDELTPEEAELLQNEPMLAVREVDLDAA